MVLYARDVGFHAFISGVPLYPSYEMYPYINFEDEHCTTTMKSTSCVSLSLYYLLCIKLLNVVNHLWLYNLLV